MFIKKLCIHVNKLTLNQSAGFIIAFAILSTNILFPLCVNETSIFRMNNFILQLLQQLDLSSIYPISTYIYINYYLKSIVIFNLIRLFHITFRTSTSVTFFLNYPFIHTDSNLHSYINLSHLIIEKRMLYEISINIQIIPYQ